MIVRKNSIAVTQNTIKLDVRFCLIYENVENTRHQQRLQSFFAPKLRKCATITAFLTG